MHTKDLMPLHEHTRIKFNIGGTYFETNITTLSTVPGTRLSSLEKCKENYDAYHTEYYFDRNPVIFNSILDLYRTGHLHLPADVCGIQIRQELEFWEIPLTNLGECCLRTYYGADDDIEIMETLQKEFSSIEKTNYKEVNDCKGFYRKVRNRLWVFLENPHSSKPALLWNWIFLVTVIMSITTYFCDTYPTFKRHEHALHGLHHQRTPMAKHQIENNISGLIPKIPNCTQPGTTMSSIPEPEEIEMVKAQRTYTMKQTLILMALDMYVNCFFTLEFILRLLSCPSILDFFKSFLNIADFLSAVGFILMMFVRWLYPLPCTNECYKDYLFLVAMTIIHFLLAMRNLRFFRIARMNKGLKLMLLSIDRSKKELGLLFLVLMIMALIFAGLMYYAEIENGRYFDQFHEALYWAIITMTTVGYGDLHPTNDMGRVVASLCAICGLIMLTMPIAVISSNFGELYSRNKERERHIRQMMSSVNKPKFENL